MQTPTIDEVRRGHAAVLNDIAEAERAYQAAAYNAAQEPTDKNRQALSEARRKLGDLRAELDGISAVRSEAERRGDIASADRVIDDIEQDAKDATAAVDALTPAFRKVYDLVQELGPALNALLDAEATANAAARTPTFDGDQFRVDALVQPLLWLALQRLGEKLHLQRSEAVMDVGGNARPERTLESLAHVQANAKRHIEVHREKRLSIARERRAQIA